jgi:hypothetical protein
MNKILAITLIFLTSITYGGDAVKWPDLLSIQSVTGRAATTEDVQSGAAVFVLQSDGKNIGTPLDIDIPQYAIHTDIDSGNKARVVVIQAEHANGQNLIGAKIIGSNEFLVGFVHEFKLLGRIQTNE